MRICTDLQTLHPEEISSEPSSSQTGTIASSFIGLPQSGHFVGPYGLGLSRSGIARPLAFTPARILRGGVRPRQHARVPLDQRMPCNTPTGYPYRRKAAGEALTGRVQGSGAGGWRMDEVRWVPFGRQRVPAAMTKHMRVRLLDFGRLSQPLEASQLP
jgi:hypothetical protein